MAVNYANYLYEPDLQRMCLNCKAADCEGICEAMAEAIRAKERERRGLAAVRVPMKLTVDGQTHTIAEWEQIIGIDRSTLRKRMDAGWEPKDIIGKPLAKHIRAKYTYDGKTLSANKWSKLLGVKPTYFYRRLNAGMTFTEIMRGAQENGLYGLSNAGTANTK